MAMQLWLSGMMSVSVRVADRSKAADPELSYVIVPALAEPNFDKLDKWYERDQGKEFGSFIVYRVKLKP